MTTKKGPALMLWITNRENTKERTLAGAAWVNEMHGKNGDFVQYSVRLNPGIVISAQLLDRCYLTLKPPLPDEMRRDRIGKRPDDAPQTDEDPGDIIK